MTYTIFIKVGYLKPIAKEIKEEEFGQYGKIVEMIYDTYDNGKVVGYKLTNSYYALATGTK